ncbi:MarR family transcriptional regulator [Streptomyces sp. NPDC002205]|uniref:MarR family winged helix-turn-helix transcriptional regulator n=1 Tax=unclassified Streptomyces TaxID=2593676 RepID=UPI00331E442E
MGTRQPRDTGAQLAAVQQLMRLLVATYAHEMDSLASELGLTRTQAILLGTATQPGSIRELAQRMGCDPSNLTGVVQRLRERDLVAVEPDPDDLRAKRISLTTTGVDTVNHLNEGTARLLTAISTATPTQLTTLEKLLRRVLNQ